jgi:DNA-binding MarR family transcriptional regulator
MAEPPTNQTSGRDQRGAPDLGIVDALVQLSFLIQGTLVAYAAAEHLSLIQARLLGILRDREPTMQALARLLDLDKSSVTGLVDRAEQRGLVRRTQAIDDRRMIRVTLTPSGRRLVDAVAEAVTSEVRSATAGLSSEEQQQLSILATRVVYEHWVASTGEESRANARDADDPGASLSVPFRLEDPRP